MYMCASACWLAQTYQLINSCSSWMLINRHRSAACAAHPPSINLSFPLFIVYCSSSFHLSFTNGFLSRPPLSLVCSFSPSSFSLAVLFLGCLVNFSTKVKLSARESGAHTKKPKGKRQKTEENKKQRHQKSSSLFNVSARQWIEAFASDVCSQCVTQWKDWMWMQLSKPHAG